MLQKFLHQIQIQFLNINQVFQKNFTDCLSYVCRTCLTKHLLYVFQKYLRRYLPSVYTTFHSFKSVFSFFKVSISGFSSVDRLSQFFAFPPRPRIERSSSWSSRRSSVLPTRSSVDPTLYSVVEIDLPLRQTNVSQLLLLVWLAVPGLAVPVGESLRRWLVWWNVGFVDNDVLCRRL